ncbi:MAG: type II toxin-antitoxin system RelE/ParE family toxin [Nitrospiraceae bacterium]|jgi:mRNA interferase RelE/StbE|nr:type II toxin-antitoxin system RelE/ParE family toxin [Nitrospiraceae bacterium]
MHQALFTVFLAPLAEQQLQAVAEPRRKLLVKQFQTFCTSPRPPGVEKIDGMDQLYRIREGDARVIYTIQGQKILLLAIKKG